MPLLPELERLTEALAKAQGEKAGLVATLAARDAFIGAVTAEKLALGSQVVDLQGTLRGREKELETLTVQLASSQKAVAERDARIASGTASIAALRQQVTELQAGATTDAKLRIEVENVRLRDAALESELSRKNADLAQVTGDYSAVQLRYNASKAEVESLSRQAAALQKERDALAQELSTLNQRTKATFSADKFADYLSKTIDRFNEQVNASSPSVNYVINELNVELKAMVGKNDANEMVLAAPALGSSQEQALSSIRLSIRSVPRE